MGHLTAAWLKRSQPKYALTESWSTTRIASDGRSPISLTIRIFDLVTDTGKRQSIPWPSAPVSPSISFQHMSRGL